MDILEGYLCGTNVNKALDNCVVTLCFFLVEADRTHDAVIAKICHQTAGNDEKCTDNCFHKSMLLIAILSYFKNNRTKIAYRF